MNEPALPYERTEVNFEAIEPNDPWRAALCKHCGREQGFHWQTADCQVWCVRNVEMQQDNG